MPAAKISVQKKKTKFVSRPTIKSRAVFGVIYVTTRNKVLNISCVAWTKETSSSRLARYTESKWREGSYFALRIVSVVLVSLRSSSRVEFLRSFYCSFELLGMNEVDIYVALERVGSVWFHESARVWGSLSSLNSAAPLKNAFSPWGHTAIHLGCYVSMQSNRLTKWLPEEWLPAHKRSTAKFHSWS